MCGLAGVINAGGRAVDRSILTSMAAVLRHRGPDDEGDYLEGGVGLAHKRLSIIDLKTGHQPMLSGDLAIVFNGEIYNYVELREELRGRGHQFHTSSDTEVILAMYAEYGVGAFDKLNGMFALLIHDRRRRLVVAARDHFGIKPLYYRLGKDHLLYGSEIKAILRHPDVQARPDRESLHDYLSFQFVLGERTLFEGIRKVMPGHYQVVHLDTLTIDTACFWEPKFKLDLYRTSVYFEDQLRFLLEDAMKLQMRSDVPVGTYLSGGMDSSIVTLLAARVATGRLKTFTGAFHEGPEFDESRYAKIVADAAGADNTVIFPTEAQFEEELPRLIWHMDEPVAGPGLFPQRMVSEVAAREVKVCLGGQGGDEIFGGYARYVVAYLEQAIKGAIFETADEGEHIVSLPTILPNLPYLRQYVPMLKRFSEAGMFEPMDRRYFRLLDRSEGDLEAFSDDFRAGYDRERVFGRFSKSFNHPDTRSYFNKMTHFDMQNSLPALLHVEDRVSMSVSLESRVPLLDRRIADLVASMPPVMKFRGAEMKYILKRAVTGLLPQPILDRKDKMGFPVPLHLWAKGRAHDFFADVLLSKTCRERGLFDAAGIEKLMGHEATFGRRLWGLLNIELWYRTFIDQS